MAEATGVTAAPVVTAVVVLPPPLTGQTLVTQAICSFFADRMKLGLYVIHNARAFRGGVWTIRKHALILGILLKLIVTRDKGQHCYFVPDAGGGLWLNVIEALTMRLAFEKVWLHHHVFSYIRRPDARMKAIHAILGSRLHHVALGEAMAKGLRDNYGAKNIFVLGNTPFVTDIPDPVVRRDLRTLGFLGNITREKGIGLFMETAAQAMADMPGLSCRIAGPIRDPDLKAEVEAFCAEDPGRRVWIGLVHGEDKKRFLSEIDVLLFPSLYENEALPMTIYEALASGAPVVATSRGCIPDQLAGLGWDFPDAEFCDRAGRQLFAWGTNAGAFSAASKDAVTQFSQQSIAHKAALETLTQELTA